MLILLCRRRGFSFSHLARAEDASRFDFAQRPIRRGVPGFWKRHLRGRVRNSLLAGGLGSSRSTILASSYGNFWTKL